MIYPGGDGLSAEISHDRSNGRNQSPVRPGYFFTPIAQPTIGRNHVVGKDAIWQVALPPLQILAQDEE